MHSGAGAPLPRALPPTDQPLLIPTPTLTPTSLRLSVSAVCPRSWACSTRTTPFCARSTAGASTRTRCPRCACSRTRGTRRGGVPAHPPAHPGAPGCTPQRHPGNHSALATWTRRWCMHPLSAARLRRMSCAIGRANASVSVHSMSACRFLFLRTQVDIHLMPNLPGSSPAMDLAMFDKVLYDQSLQADQWKIYPCEVVPWTQIKKWCASFAVQPAGARVHGCMGACPPTHSLLGSAPGSTRAPTSRTATRS